MGNIFGLGFAARAGKDSVADWLVENHGFKKTGFAESLKDACRVIFKLSEEQLYGDLKETVDDFWQTTPRDIMQRVGTEAMREGFDKDVWVKALERKIKGAPDQNWVIVDVRFPNESEAVKDWGGKIYRIDRPGIKNAVGNNTHASETSRKDYDGWDGIINNDGTLEDLYKTAAKILEMPPL